MSYSAVASYPSNSYVDSFEHNKYEDLGADFFEQFITFSPVESEELDLPVLPHSVFLQRSSSNDHSGNTSSCSPGDRAEDAIENDQWQGEFWDQLNISAASQGKYFYSELSGRAALSDSELLSLEGITLESPLINAHYHPSLPSSPSPAVAALPRRKNRIVETFSKTFKRATENLEKTLRSPIRKPSSSPKTMRTSHKNNSSVWDQKLQSSKFEHLFDDVAPLSPPSSAGAACAPDNWNSRKFANEDLYGEAIIQQFANGSLGYETPLSTPLLDTEPSRKTSDERCLSDSLFPATPQLPHNSDTWAQMRNSSELKAFGTPSIYPSEADQPLWWNHAAAAPIAQPSPTALHTNPQRATKSLALQLQNEVSYHTNAYIGDNISSGLMIQMPGMAQQSFVESPIMQQGYFSPPQPQYRSQPPRHYARVPLRQPPSSSPIRRNRSGSSDSDSPSPKTSPAFHVRKRRTHKSKQSTPRTPTPGGAVDFVNFTPSDSRKILTGVAPSGSSKTKARREKEAMDKRRKFSQAAFRAVRELGGDAGSLVEQGLLMR